MSDRTIYEVLDDMREKLLPAILEEVRFRIVEGGSFELDNESATALLAVTFRVSDENMDLEEISTTSLDDLLSEFLELYCRLGEDIFTYDLDDRELDDKTRRAVLCTRELLTVLRKHAQAA